MQYTVVSYWKKFLLAFFAPGKLARFRFPMKKRNWWWKYVFPHLCLFPVKVQPHFPGTLQRLNEGAVSLHHAPPAAFSTHFSQEQFFWRKASSCASLPLPWLYWQRAHLNSKFNFHNQKKDASVWRVRVLVWACCPSQKTPPCTQWQQTLRVCRPGEFELY